MLNSVHYNGAELFGVFPLAGCSQRYSITWLSVQAVIVFGRLHFL
jgi:hypothetical protein